MIYNKETNLWEIDSKIYLTDEEFQQYINTIFEDKDELIKKQDNTIERALKSLDNAIEYIRELQKGMSLWQQLLYKSAWTLT